MRQVGADSFEIRNKKTGETKIVTGAELPKYGLSKPGGGVKDALPAIGGFLGGVLGSVAGPLGTAGGAMAGTGGGYVLKDLLTPRKKFETTGKTKAGFQELSPEGRKMAANEGKGAIRDVAITGATTYAAGKLFDAGGKLASKAAGKGSDLISKLSGKAKAVVDENKANSFLKNLNFKPKDPAFAEQQTKDALEVAKKYLKVEDTPQLMQTKLTAVRDKNAELIKKALTKAKQVIPIDDLQNGSLRTELNSVVTQNPNNPQLTKLLKTFDEKLSSNISTDGLSGKGFKSVFDWVGSQKRSLSDPEARKAASNIYGVLKAKMPEKLQQKMTEDYVIGQLLKGVNNNVVKGVRTMSGDTLTQGKKTLGSIFGGGGVVGKGLATKEILDLIRGK